VTNGLDEWDDADATANGPSSTPSTPSTTSAIATAVAAVDLDAAMRDAARSALRKRLDTIAVAAVDAQLDDATLAQLRATADDAARAAMQDAAAPQVDGAEPELYYPDVVSFVTKHLAPMYRRSLSANSTTWCPQWWRHAEAIARLEALWRSWEHLRLGPSTGTSVWFRDHADHHMAVLLSADGPFKGCKPDGHGERLQPLPLIAPPDGLW